MKMLSLIFFMLILHLSAGAFAAEPQMQACDLTRIPAAGPQARNSAVFPAFLERIDKIAGTAGILVTSLSTGEVVVESRPNDLFVPASLMKLLTSYAALKKLGPAFRFTTKVFSAEDAVDGVIPGDIWVKGSGDPFFTSDSALELARTLRDKGIRQIRGSVFVDNSFFDPLSEHICLDSDCKGIYNPVISAAAIDFNTVTVRIRMQGKKATTAASGLAEDYVRVSGQARKTDGPARLLSLGAAGNGREQFQLNGRMKGSRVRDFRANAVDPSGLFAHAFRTALERSGVKVLGTEAKEGKTPPGAKPIASYDSPPIAELLGGLNKYSNNFMAEMLLRSLGGCTKGAPGNSEKGLAVVRSALREAGIPEEIAALDCGSGLSRLSRISPETLSRLLTAAWNDNEIRDEFISSLAVNGERGTLKRRMHKPGLTVRGKTGTLDDVIGFAGYVSGPSGKTFAAAIVLNEVQDRFEARQAVDALLESVAFSAP
jgi:D-alanyl-D-alanine carboxypeptidase/D-alanyl-D-alanine-endopeptidase (penicillin-binding protein 4)